MSRNVSSIVPASICAAMRRSPAAGLKRKHLPRHVGERDARGRFHEAADVERRRAPGRSCGTLPSRPRRDRNRSSSLSMPAAISGLAVGSVRDRPAWSFSRSGAPCSGSVRQTGPSSGSKVSRLTGLPVFLNGADDALDLDARDQRKQPEQLIGRGRLRRVRELRRQAHEVRRYRGI